MRGKTRYLYLLAILATFAAMRWVALSNFYVTRSVKQGYCNPILGGLCNPDQIYQEKVNLLDGHRLVINSVLSILVIVFCYGFLHIRAKTH